MVIKYYKNSELNCIRTFIFITSENFERKVCKELGWIAVRSLLNLSAQLDNTNLGQPITK